MLATRSKRGQDEDSDTEFTLKNTRCSGDEDDKRGSLLSPSSNHLLGLNGLRGRPATDKPAELFRKDLISAMKLADTDALQDEDFFLISDPWRQEWERGVQVPVNPENIPVANCRLVEQKKRHHGGVGFKLPRKLLHAMQDDQFKQGIHDLHEIHKLAEQVCRYDLDDQDVHWLVSVNEEREMAGNAPIEESQMEKVMEELESQCHSNMQVMIKTVEGLGIEYDENVVCDVCRSPDSEDSNEMVFCDQCDICVHQACYGIQTIPEGNWLCRVCTLGIRPTCILCPKAGGAMKSTKSGSKWSHVSCALWIPEVSIGCPEKMEPITKISQIPSSRWALICSLCRERTGACIQCSVKTCKTAFHVTCAFQHGLEMKTVLEDDEEEIQLKAYCAKHTKKRAEAEGGTPRKEPFLTSSGTPKKESEMTEEEKKELRSHRLKKLAEEFYSCVKVPEVAIALQMENDVIDFIYNYWLLKRKSNFNKPLLTPKTEEEDLLSKQQEDCLIARMKMFVHLRQDLERVRNLCYMVTRREKMSRTFNRFKEEIFRRQASLLSSTEHHHHPGSHLQTRELRAIHTAHRTGGGFYDDYDFIFRTAEEASGGQPVIDGPIDHKLDTVRVRHPGRPRLSLGGSGGMGGVLRDFDSDCDSLTGNVNTPPHAAPQSGRVYRRASGKQRDLLHSRLHHRHRVRGGHDKEQVDPRVTLSTKEVLRRRHHAEHKWVAAAPGGGGGRNKVVRDSRHSLLSRRRLAESNIARQKHRLTKYEKRTTSLSGESAQPRRLPPPAELSSSSSSSSVTRYEKRASLSNESTQPKRLPPTELSSSSSSVEQQQQQQQQQQEQQQQEQRQQQQQQQQTTKTEAVEVEVVVKEDVLEQPQPELPQINNKTEANNGPRPNSNLVVGQSIREKVQSRLHRTLPVNGLYDQAQHKIDNYFKSVEQSGLEPLKAADGAPLIPSSAKSNTTTTTTTKEEPGGLDRERVRRDSQRFRQGVFGRDSPPATGEGLLDEKKPATLVDSEQRLVRSGGGGLGGHGGGGGAGQPGRLLAATEAAAESSNTPETRAKRRKIESDLESESNLSERLFENVDGEVSIRSSRDTTPEREASGPVLRNSRSRGLELQRLSTQRHLESRLRSHRKQETEGSHEDGGSGGAGGGGGTTTTAAGGGGGGGGGGETDSEYADSESSGHAMRTRRSKLQAENVEETASVDSTASSGSKYSTRSRVTLEQSSRAAASALHS